MVEREVSVSNSLPLAASFGYGDGNFSILLGSFHRPIPVRCNWSVFAREMHSTSEFAMIVLSKCVHVSVFVRGMCLFVFVCIYRCLHLCSVLIKEAQWQPVLQVETDKRGKSMRQMRTEAQNRTRNQASMPECPCSDLSTVEVWNGSSLDLQERAAWQATEAIRPALFRSRRLLKIGKELQSPNQSLKIKSCEDSLSPLNLKVR